jgi:phosphoglucosamine mutase
MKKLFGTDGMRGKAGVFPLDSKSIRTVGVSLGIHLTQKLGRPPSIVIGRDTRESGEWLEASLTEGLISSGAQCHSAGVITTPGVAFLTRTLPADAGVVISASHNEYQDNGIKIFAPSGQKLDEDTEQQIEADIYATDASRVNDASVGAVNNGGSADQLQRRYLEYLVNDINQRQTFPGLSIVVDCANGAAYSLAPKLFERLGAKATVINCSPDGRNINRDSGSLHIEGLQRAVVNQRADLGVAFDGDADRVLFVDHEGLFVDGDATLWVMAQALASRAELSTSTVVATVMSNIGLEIALRTIGLRLVRTDVGDKYVLEELLRSGASLGGEQSGHIIFPKLSLAGDGLITTLLLLRTMKERGASLRELTAGLERYPQVLVNVKVKEKVPFSEIPNLMQVTLRIEKELGENGRLLLRYSGTEALARIMIEGRSQPEIEAYADELARLIRDAIGND